jgi:DNA-binding MurR/RpiR family transcriptional regulator
VSEPAATVTTSESKRITSRATSSRHRNDKLVRLLLSSPDMTEPELASKAGCSVSTVSRTKAALRAGAMANGNGVKGSRS